MLQIETVTDGLNDLPVKANYKVRVDDRVRFIIPDSVEPDIPAQDIPLDIIYEDSDILIVNNRQWNHCLIYSVFAKRIFREH